MTDSPYREPADPVSEETEGATVRVYDYSLSGACPICGTPGASKSLQRRVRAGITKADPIGQDFEFCHYFRKCECEFAWRERLPDMALWRNDDKFVRVTKKE